MTKTPEQSAADDALEAAVQRVVRAYGIVPDKSMITDYIVIGEATQFTEDGDSTCDVFTIYQNGHIRLTTALGLIELGRRELMTDWAREDRD